MSSVPMEIIGASTSNPTQKAVNAADPSISYVNTGLERWKAMREKWVKKREDESPKEIQRKYTNPLNLLLSKLPNGTTTKKKKPTIDYDTIYNELLLNNNCVLSQSVPLPQLVEILVEIWEDDGLYDAISSQELEWTGEDEPN